MHDGIALHAFVDESGHRAARTKGASAHFVLSAAVVAVEALPAAAATLAELRGDIGRRPNHPLRWNQIKQHSQRLHVAQTLGRQPWLTVAAVVVCKDHLPVCGMDDDSAYLYTLRYLLERLSWFARERNQIMACTIAHVVRLKLAKLRAYESTLRSQPGCQIAWPWLGSSGVAVDQPTRLEYLQLGDLTASAIACGFEPDQFGNTENRYLCHLSPRLYRRMGNLTSYGLKMHPWSDSTRAAYPWVAAL
jgi:hypothetical protein